MWFIYTMCGFGLLMICTLSMQHPLHLAPPGVYMAAILLGGAQLWLAGACYASRSRYEPGAGRVDD